jgi:hypothetical protein
MSMLWVTSYAVLSAILAFEWMALHALVKEMMRLKRRYLQESKHAVVGSDLLGKTAPKFIARVLDSEETVTNDALIGAETILLFIGKPPKRVDSSVDLKILSMLGGLVDRVERRLHVVVQATPSECRFFKDEYYLDVQFGSRLLFITDERGKLRRVFGIESTPAAVKIDDEGFVAKLGIMISGDVGQAENSRLMPDAEAV